MRYRELFAEEDVPANNAGSGQVAAIGVGPDGEPGVSPDRKKKRPILQSMMSREVQHG